MRQAKCQLFLLITILIILSGCNTLKHSQTNIRLGDRAAMSFTGRGASAGIMMDAYLGGAGVAIGVAIDEGIAKDIAANLRKKDPDFDMLTLTRNELKSLSKKQNRKVLEKIQATKIIVETYGFRSAPGEGDKVVPWLKVRFEGPKDAQTLIYPDASPEAKSITFDEAKGNPEVAYGALKNATHDLLGKWIQALR